MDYNKLLYLNFMIGFSVLIPLVYCFINFKLVIKYNKWLFVYLTIAFITEVYNLFAYFIFKNTSNLGLLFFSLIESILFLLILSQWGTKKYKSLNIVVVSIIFSVFGLDVLLKLSPPYYTFTIGFIKMALVFSSLYLLIKNNQYLNKYSITSTYAILFFSVSTVSINTLVTFFTSSIEYKFYYSMVLSSANVIYYILFTISIVQMKNIHFKK